MTKEEFYKQVNYGRCPKYVFSQIKEETPEHDCAAIVCTKSGKTMIAKYENGKWQQAHFTSAKFRGRQEIYYDDITEKVVYWTDGKAEDYSRRQHE